jgi:hypothetical protein
MPVYSQWILGMTVQPANPTSSDTIRIYANVSFPSGGCDIKSQTLSVAGNHVYAGAIHCLGMATFICNTTDTFLIEPMPSGTYTFHMQLDAGAGPGPCTPGVVPGTQDSITFTVTQSSSLPEIPEGADFSIFPIPAKDKLTVITRNEPAPGTIFEIFDMNGKRAVTVSLTGKSNEVNLSSLAGGSYIARISSPGMSPAEQKFTVVR